MAKKNSSSVIRAKLAEALDGAKKGGSRSSSRTTMTKAEAEPTIEAPTIGSVSTSATRIVNGSMLMAAGAGAIPLPIWDAAAITAVQVKMLSDLSALYGVPFKENLGQNLVATLVGGLAPGMLVRGAAGTYLKSIPGIGSVLGALLQPAFAAALTYGVGNVFIRHYESGGTLLSFNPTEFKTSFTEEVKAGLKKAKDIKL